MINLLRRMGRYITAALTGKFNEVADPKVQLEQAIQEAQDQHRRTLGAETIRVGKLGRHLSSGHRTGDETAQ